MLLSYNWCVRVNGVTKTFILIKHSWIAFEIFVKYMVGGFDYQLLDISSSSSVVSEVRLSFSWYCKVNGWCNSGDAAM